MAMENRRPTYDLQAIEAAFATPGKLAITTTAFSDALRLGYDRAGIVAVIQFMRRGTSTSR